MTVPHTLPRCVEIVSDVRDELHAIASRLMASREVEASRRVRAQMERLDNVTPSLEHYAKKERCR